MRITKEVKKDLDMLGEMPCDVIAHKLEVGNETAHFISKCGRYLNKIRKMEDFLRKQGNTILLEDWRNGKI